MGGGLGWGASALPLELYSTDLTCVHAPTHLHHHHHLTDATTTQQQQQQPSAVFLQETAASWAGLGEHQPGFTAAAHNPAFAGDDPAAVLPLVMETKDFPPPSPTSPGTASLPPFQDTLQDRIDHNDYSISQLDKK